MGEGGGDSCPGTGQQEKGEGGRGGRGGVQGGGNSRTGTGQGGGVRGRGGAAARSQVRKGTLISLRGASRGAHPFDSPASITPHLQARSPRSMKMIWSSSGRAQVASAVAERDQALHGGGGVREGSPAGGAAGGGGAGKEGGGPWASLTPPPEMRRLSIFDADDDWAAKVREEGWLYGGGGGGSKVRERGRLTGWPRYGIGIRREEGATPGSQQCGGGQLVGTLFFFLPLFAEMKMCSYLFPYNFHISFHFPSQDTSPCCPT